MGTKKASPGGSGSSSCVVIAVALAGGLLACGPGAPSSPPHVVLIVIDTLRADRLGSYGFEDDTSPEIDALARAGVRFERVTAQSPWTRPSIASLLTSRHPRALGIYDERRHALPDGVPTLAEVLSSGGYRTLGATANPNVNSIFQFDRGFDEYLDSTVLFGWMPEEPGKVMRSERSLQPAAEMFGALLARVKTGELERPWYLQVTLMEVHEAFRPEVEHAEFSGHFGRRADARYLEAVRRVSSDIGDFLDSLAALPGWEHHLFVVTSDHGQGLLDHPHVERSQSHGHLLYESQLRVPLILAGTAGSLPRGRVVEDPVRLLDVMPTVLDLVGVQSPASLSGSSLVPLIRGTGVADLPDVFVAETEFRSSQKLAASTSEWRYVESSDGQAGTNPRELQRIGVVADGARTDVARDHTDVVAKLAAHLRAWERSHPRAEPTAPGRALLPAEIQQLIELGYLAPEE